MRMGKRIKIQGIILTAVSVFAASKCAVAQSTISATDGYTPAGMQTAGPASSYPLSGFDRYSPFSGAVNMAIPLHHVGGRGEAGFDLVWHFQQRWFDHFELQGNANPVDVITTFEGSGSTPQRLGPGTLIGRHAVQRIAGSVPGRHVLSGSAGGFAFDFHGCRRLGNRVGRSEYDGPAQDRSAELFGATDELGHGPGNSIYQQRWDFNAAVCLRLDSHGRGSGSIWSVFCQWLLVLSKRGEISNRSGVRQLDRGTGTVTSSLSLTREVTSQRSTIVSTGRSRSLIKPLSSRFHIRDLADNRERSSSILALWI